MLKSKKQDIPKVGTEIKLDEIESKIQEVINYITTDPQDNLVFKKELKKKEIMTWNLESMNGKNKYYQAEILSHFKKLDDCGMNLTFAELQTVTGMSSTTIGDRLKIFKLPVYVQDMIKADEKNYKFLPLNSFQRFYENSEINKDGRLDQEVKVLVEEIIAGNWTSKEITDYVDNRVKELADQELVTYKDAMTVSLHQQKIAMEKALHEKQAALAIAENKQKELALAAQQWNNRQESDLFNSNGINVSLMYRFSISLKKPGEEIIPWNVFIASEHILKGINLPEIYANALEWKSKEEKNNVTFLIEKESIENNATLSQVAKIQRITNLEEEKNQLFVLKTTFEQEAKLLEGLVLELSKPMGEQKELYTDKQKELFIRIWIKEQIDENNMKQSPLAEGQKEKNIFSHFTLIKDYFLQATIIKRLEAAKIPVEKYMEKLLGNVASTIRLRSSIFELPQEVQDMVKNGTILYSNIEVLRQLGNTIKDEKERYKKIIVLARKFSQENTSCNQARKLVKAEIKEHKNSKSKQETLDENSKKLEKKMLDLIGKLSNKKERTKKYEEFAILRINVTQSRNQEELIKSYDEYEQWRTELITKIINESRLKLKSLSQESSNPEREAKLARLAYSSDDPMPSCSNSEEATESLLDNPKRQEVSSLCEEPTATILSCDEQMEISPVPIEDSSDELICDERMEISPVPVQDKPAYSNSLCNQTHTSQCSFN